MQLTSPAFSHGGNIPKQYTCQGDDVHPALEIAQVPSRTQSLALIMDDPDVPESIRADRMYVHWVMYNIDPTTTQIPERVLLPWTQGQNTSGSHGYMGPCPPDREHRYFFTLYALDTRLSLASGATKQELLQAMTRHILAEAVLMGRYVQFVKFSI